MSNPSAFDAASFGQMQFDQANDTESPKLPDAEYSAQIKGPFGEDKCTRIRQVTSKAGEDFLMLDVVWEITDQTALDAAGFTKFSARQSFFLDLTETGSLDFGKNKNADLGRLRTAIGMNVPGQAWSFNDFPGRAAIIKTKGRDDGDKHYTDVVGVAKY